ncbi:MAG TPA: hypothetical protein VK524_06025 [Polyangiaceae bacterium]|nr:hypothetical protein [Polyangiaceae bacterium]
MKRSLLSLLLVVIPVPALAQQPMATRDAALDPRIETPSAAVATGPVTQHWQASLNLDVLIRKDSSFDVLSDEDLEPALGASIGYAFWLTEALSLAPELGYAGSHTEGGVLLGGAIEQTELTSYAGYAGVSARYEIWEVFAPHARLAAGVARTEFTLDTQVDGTFEKADWLPFVTLGLGATVTTPDRLFQSRSGKFESLSVGLTLEGGYWASPALTATLESRSEGRLTIEQPSLGALSRSGPYLRFALVARL